MVKQLAAITIAASICLAATAHAEDCSVANGEKLLLEYQGYYYHEWLNTWSPDDNLYNARWMRYTRENLRRYRASCPQVMVQQNPDDSFAYNRLPKSDTVR